VTQAQPRRQVSQVFVKAHDGGALHLGRSFLGRIPARGSRYIADYFDQTNGRDQKLARVMDGRRKEALIGAFEE
jgi:hypothetical protein